MQIKILYLIGKPVLCGAKNVLCTFFEARGFQSRFLMQIKIFMKKIVDKPISVWYCFNHITIGGGSYPRQRVHPARSAAGIPI